MEVCVRTTRFHDWVLGEAQPDIDRSRKRRFPYVVPALTAALACSAAPPARGAEGTLIDVGGYRLYCRVAGSGSPTVVFEAGQRYWSDTWQPVWPAVAALTRVFLYDRAGLGRSEPGRMPRTSATIAGELATLLARARVEGPYVLVGHSFGGLHARVFAGRHPELVSGMVLVDSDHPDERAAFLDAVSAEDRQSVARHWVPPPASLSDNEESYRQARAIRSLGSLPLAVMAHGVPPWDYVSPDGSRRLHATWLRLQRELAALSTAGTFRVATRSGHFIQSDQPDLVIEAIRDVVARARAARRPVRASAPP